MGHTNDRSTKATSLVNPTSLNLQPRPFAPLESDEKEEAVARKSGYSENFLEKIINTPRSESATPVQRKSGNPLKAIVAERIAIQAKPSTNVALQNQPVQRQESAEEEKSEGEQEDTKEFTMNPEPPPVQRKFENRLRAKNAQRMEIQAKLAIGEPNDKYEQEADATAARVVQQINSPITSQGQPVQRKFENRLRAKNAQKMAIQTKLAIGEPNDKYEQEADATAARVVQQINSPITSQNQPVQRQEIEEDELQMKPLIQRRESIGGGEASTDLESAIQSARGSGQSLDANLQQSMGQAMGADFSGVKVHTDSQSDQLNKSIQAKAFTTGQDLFFRQGAYEPSSRGGQELIAHELTHVVQQNSSTIQAKSEFIQRDTVQEEDDADFDYNGKYIESAINTKVVLKKQKTLYKDKGSTPCKDKNSKDVVIDKGTLVDLLESPSSEGMFSRSYAKIKALGKEGWINTKNAVTKSPILGHDSAGVIMSSDPTVEDVKQGMFGDCFLLAALMSLVQNKPDYVKNGLFQTDPTKDAEEHTVRFFKFTNYSAEKSPDQLTFAPENVKVNNTILKVKTKIEKPSETIEENTPVGSRGNQPWPAIVEKAFAKFPKDGMPNSTSLDGGQGSTASMVLTGEGYKKIEMGKGTGGEQREMVNQGKASSVEEAQQIILKNNQKAAKEGIIQSFEDQPSKLKTAGTQQSPPDEWLKNNAAEGKGGSGEMKVGGIAFKHVYSIVGADDNEIKVRNPWGKYSRVKGKVKQDEAVSILTWDEFYQVFSDISFEA